MPDSNGRGRDPENHGRTYPCLSGNELSTLSTLGVTSTLIHGLSAECWYINALRKVFPSFLAVALLHLKSLTMCRCGRNGNLTASLFVDETVCYRAPGRRTRWDAPGTSS